MSYRDYDDDLRTDKASLEAARAKAVRRYGVFENVEHEQAIRSQYWLLLDEVTTAALDYALQNKMDVITFCDGPLSESIDIVSKFDNATRDPWKQEISTKETAFKRLLIWVHNPELAQSAEKNVIPYFERSALEEAVGSYLALSFRSPSLDRLFVDALIAMELVAFYRAMLHGPALGFPGLTAPLQRPHALTTFARNLANHRIVLVVGLALYFYGHGGASWGELVALVGALSVLYALCMMIANVIWLPINWRVTSVGKKLAMDLMHQINMVYLQLNSSDPISAQFIHSRVVSAAEKGVVWPAPLMALLDDINKRGGRF